MLDIAGTPETDRDMLGAHQAKSIRDFRRRKVPLESLERTACLDATGPQVPPLAAARVGPLLRLSPTGVNAAGITQPSTARTCLRIFLVNVCVHRPWVPS